MGHLQTPVKCLEARVERLVQPGRESQRIPPPHDPGYNGGSRSIPAQPSQGKSHLDRFFSFLGLFRAFGAIWRPDSESS